MARACLFCGGRPLTKEHVLPRWLERVLTVSDPGYLTFKGREVRQMYGFDLELRAVCESCNNGWLHDLEAAFRAVSLAALTGHAMQPENGLSFDHGAQQVLATWAVKTWQLADRALKTIRHGALDLPIPRYLREHNKPPETIQVFVAAIGDAPAPVGTANLTILRPDRTIDAVLAYLVVGPLVFLMFVANPYAATRLPNTPRLRPARRLARAFSQIWPHEVAEVGWPPAAVLTLRGLEAMIPIGPSRWSELAAFQRDV